MMECKRFENLVDGYVDGELDAVHAAELEVHAAECASCARVVEGRRALKAALKQVLPRYEMPAELRAKIEAAGRRGEEGARRRFVPAWMPRALAACFMIAVGGLAGYLLRAPGGPVVSHQAMLLASIEGDHVRSLQVDHLVDVAATRAEALKPWFKERVKFAPPVAELADYELMGGRTEVVEGHEAVAAVVYKHGGHVINLMAWPEKGPVGSEGQFEAMASGRGYHAVKWFTENGMECWAISDMDAEEVMKFSKAFYEGAEKGEG